ncbi:neurexin 1 isoform X2 [Cylas formicarius]|uniref:neurexin 1 isoform X2 n=1 Tax=Cylas formicarius TaxID=197179 RepID=UPI0029585E79|nr:neurexin 1 isoform X2 [Cylas formicarius]
MTRLGAALWATILLCRTYAFVLDGSKNSYSQFRKWGGGTNGSLEFEFKTEQPNGLLLYSDDGGTYDFFEIKLVEGALRLRYNLGGGAQIITIGRDLNDGHWHKVQVQRQEERTMLTVDGVSQMRTSRGKEFNFGRFATNSDVFVGGMPLWYNSKLTLLALPSVIFEPRFIGSVRNLIYSDTEGGVPRRQETRPKDQRCDGPIVPGTESICLPQSRVLRGNSSDACEIRDPCQHGGICISTDSGPICECRNSDYEGEFCEKDKAPSEAVFRGTEFLSYDLSQTGGEPIVSAQDTITLYFKTRQPNGLLFYTGEGSDYLNVAIKDGCLSLTMGLANGKQEMQIKPNKVRFDDNQWHKVSVHRRIQEISAITSFCRLSAVVDGVYADHSHIAGKFTMLSSSRLYVGGSINTRALPGARVHNNFVGCMRKVEFVADTLRLNLLELGRSGSHLIQVVGRVDYKCPTGETHDPITFTTRESHLVLPTWNAKKSGNISFKFRTNEANGLILFNSGAPAKPDLFAVEIYNGHIYIYLDLGGGLSKQRGSRRRIDDGTWHEVTFRRTGRDSRITVDGFHTDFKAIEGSTTLELESNLYVGGLGPPFSEIPVSPGLWTAVLQQGFVGCFKDLVMNNEPVDVASFARDQDSGSIRTLCHTQPQQCPSQPCLNGGTCMEGWNRFICDCTNTMFSGPTCGKEAATLSFNGSQHMAVTMDSEMVTQTEDIILRFRTSKPLGLLLISSTADTGDRIELAVAAGRIRLALRLDVKERKKEDREKDKILLAGQNVNDNEWHTVRFSRRGANLKLQLDNQSPIRAEIQGKYTTLQWRTIHIGGLYHAEEEISMTTTVPNFIGEIQQFYFNNIPYIELARALSTEQSISGFPKIRVAGKFVKHATDNLHRPVTFRSKHTFIGLPMLRAYSSIHIDFMFKTREANGLIMFNGGKKEDFLAVEMLDGHINYIVNVGDGTVTLRDTVRNHLNDNRWHTVGIRRPSARQHTLMVDDDIVVATNYGSGNLELDGILYLGGVYKDLYPQLPQDDVKSKHGFEGCIAGLDLNGESPNIVEDAVVHSSLVTAGCESQSAKCSHNVCANAGICVQQWNAYTCDCDLTSFTGPTCSDESVSYEFGPNPGIITYTFPEDNRPEMQEDAIAIGFITTKSDAVLLRITSGTSNDYIEMYIVEGNVFVVYNLGTNDHPLGEISVKVNDNQYHVVKFHRHGHNSTLQVDDYNVQTSYPAGDQLKVFNTQSQIQIGGKWSRGKKRIERPFSGIISGVVVNRLRILDLAAEKDVHVSIRGDVALVSGILDRHDHLQKMQQTPPSGFPGLEDDLIFSGAGSGCNGDDEDECPPLPEVGSGDDDLITPVYVPPTRPPPTAKPKKIPDEGKGCDDDDDCIAGSGSGENTEDPFTSSKATGVTEVTDSTFTPVDNSSTKIVTEEGSTTSIVHHTTFGVGYTNTSTESGVSSTPIQITTKSHVPTTYVSTEMTYMTSPPTTKTTEKFIDLSNEINNKPKLPHLAENYPHFPNKPIPPPINSETSETVALIIGIIAGALIAVILIILIILKFKSRSDISFKVDDSKEYPHGPGAALLGSTGSSTNGQTQYQLNGNLRNGDKGQPQQQKTKKRDSKDIKEWYV